MVASGQQRMPLRQEDQRFTVQASLHGIKNVSVLDLHQLHEKLNLTNLPNLSLYNRCFYI